VNGRHRWNYREGMRKRPPPPGIGEIPYEETAPRIVGWLAWRPGEWFSAVAIAQGLRLTSSLVRITLVRMAEAGAVETCQRANVQSLKNMGGHYRLNSLLYRLPPRDGGGKPDL
jgi:hypothetical protein